ncbi:hypothetical protein [Streptomyces goshikiensis]|uniref:hypothetical protein n=1 Tax=Streptomyces goshikiensis TaxID=1942 RepID=UPI0036B0EE61
MISAGTNTTSAAAGIDARALARYAGAVLQGMSQQSRDGATRAEPEAVAELAPVAWPA